MAGYQVLEPGTAFFQLFQFGARSGQMLIAACLFSQSSGENYLAADEGLEALGLLGQFREADRQVKPVLLVQPSEQQAESCDHPFRSRIAIDAQARKLRRRFGLVTGVGNFSGLQPAEAAQPEVLRPTELVIERVQSSQCGGVRALEAITGSGAVLQGKLPGAHGFAVKAPQLHQVERTLASGYLDTAFLAAEDGARGFARLLFTGRGTTNDVGGAPVEDLGAADGIGVVPEIQGAHQGFQRAGVLLPIDHDGIVGAQVFAEIGALVQILGPGLHPVLLQLFDKCRKAFQGCGEALGVGGYRGFVR